MKFVHFKKSLDEGVSPIYLFDGEEEYFKERGEEMLKERFLGEPSLNYSAFHGESLKGAALTSLVVAAQSFPFMSEKRIVKVTNLYPSERDYETYLRSYFEHPPESTILLIVNASSPKGKAYDLKKAPNVTNVDCSKADDETILRWIYAQFRRAGIAADTECCERLLEYCLGDMSRIAGETEKLLAYGAKDKKISSNDVDAVVYRDTDYKIYEMTNALGAKNYGKYLSVMSELFERGIDAMAVLNSLCSYFRGLFELSLMNKTDAEAAAVLGMKEYAVKMNRRQLASWGNRRAEDCFLAVNGALNGVKNGVLTAEGALIAVNARLAFAGSQK